MFRSVMNFILQERGYTNIYEIGRGSFGGIFVATKNGRRLAVKVIQQSLEDDLEKLVQFEADYMRGYASQCKNICVAQDYFQADGYHFLEMKLYTTDLNKILVQHRQVISEKAAKHIMRHIYDAVYFIHGRQILHRDIKPENIFVDCSEQLWEEFKNRKLDAETFILQCTFLLGDFGVSKYIDQLTDTYVGSLSTMAPEIRLKQHYSYPIDIYSLGIIYYKLVENRQAINPLIFNSDLTTETKEIISIMISKDPKSRPSKNQLDKYFGFNRFRNFTPPPERRIKYIPQQPQATNNSLERKKKNIQVYEQQNQEITKKYPPHIIQTPTKDRQNQFFETRRDDDRSQVIEKKLSQTTKFDNQGQFIPRSLQETQVLDGPNYNQNNLEHQKMQEQKPRVMEPCQQIQSNHNRTQKRKFVSRI